MKKITLSLVLFLTLVLSGYGQVSYEYGFEPATPPLGEWTAVGFTRQTITPCVGTASVRANTYSSPNSMTSPSLGTSNGGVVTFSFDYKLLNWSANTVATPANQVSIVAEWANSATGPWFPIGTIDESNHEVSTTCATKTFQFSPTPGSLFVKIISNAINGSDVYVYYDNIILSQGEAPTCVSPSNLLASNVLNNTATLSWGGVTPTPAIGYEYYYSDVNQAPTASGTPTTSMSAALTGLMSNTNYYFWVRTMCSDGQSVWSGPVNFRTLCDAFEDFTENFDTATVGTGVVPLCWKKIVTSTSTFANASVINYTASSSPNALYMTNSDDANAQIYLISPSLLAISANTHRMKFKARGGVAGQILSVGTMSDPTDASTYVEIQSYTLTATYSDYSVSLNTSTTAGHIAFKHGLGGTYRSVYLDDMLWEPIPSSAPGCIEDMNAVINEGCGNFPTTFTWTAVPGADGYKVNIGTSPNGADLVVNNLDINSALSYSFVGNPGTNYYFTINPYNANGSATGCFEDNFTTFDDGCYCISGGSNVDGVGITSVTVNGEQFSNTQGSSTATPPVPVYTNHTEEGAVDITQGLLTQVQVALSTGSGYDYHTVIWIDANDNFTFENTPEERVYVGVSVAAPITTLNASFLLPTNTPSGEHRMRIVSSDSEQIPSNPCYTGFYGETVDMLVNVLPAPTCLPPSASTTSNITADGATITWVSTGTLFNVEVLFAGEAQGSGTITSGIAANTTALSGLDSQTNYAYYLQTDCGSGSTSPWTGPFTFRTGCESFGEFTEDFTTETTIPAPECWYTLKSTADQFARVSISSFSDYVEMYNSADAAAALYLITPGLTDISLNTYRIKFKAYSFTAGVSVVVGTMSDPSNASTFTAVQTIPMTNAFANYSVSFINSTTDDHVAFKFVGTGTFQYLYIDDVSWEIAPTCPDVNVVSFNGATPYTADISWTPGGAETAWQYAYALSTVEEPDGLTTYDVATTPSTTIPGLAQSTTYKVWVRASCGSEFGIWSPAKTFTTACVAVTEFPWTEGFENITPGFNIFPNCWSKENGDFSTANTSSSTYNTPRTGSNYLRDSWAATNEYMWTPGFELTAGVSYDFSFYMQGDGFTGWTVDVFQNMVQNSTGATQLGGTTTASGTGAYVIQPYALVSNTFVPATSGIYYFAVRVNQPSSTPWYIAFDDFRMEPTPSCLAPNAPTATDITVTTATMNWVATTPAPANGYDYYVSDTAIAPNASTTPTGTVAAGITTVSLTTLMSSTIYRVYVRSNCGTGDISSWSDAGLFTTPCAAFNAPFSQDFSTFLPLCWARAAAGTVATGPTGTAVGIWETDGFLNNGNTGAVKVNLYSTNRIGWLITPEMNTTVGQSYSLSFNYGVTDWNETVGSAMGSDDFVRIAMSTDNGVTWSEIHIFNAASNVTNTSQEYVYEMTATTSQIKFAFIASDGTVDDDVDYDFFIDNVGFETTLSNVDFDKNSFTAYPNPVKDVLNVSFTQNISNVAVYNLLGQQVLVMNMNANKGQIDMSSLASGTYLVKVNTENGVKTIKVIKE